MHWQDIKITSIRVTAPEETTSGQESSINLVSTIKSLLQNRHL